MMRDEGLTRRLVVRRGPGGNCTYDETAKREVIELCLRSEKSVAKVARTYELTPNQLHNWNGLYRKTSANRLTHRPAESTVGRAPAFIPIFSMLHPAASNVLQIQITLPNGIQAEFGGIRREDVAVLLTDLSRLPCSASTRD